MNRTLELQQKKSAVLKSAGDIMNKVAAEGRTSMSAEERTQFDGFTKEAEEIAGTLEAYTKLQGLETNVQTDKPQERARVEVHDNWTDNMHLFGRAPRQGETAKERKVRLYSGFGEQLAAVKHAQLVRVSGTTGEVDKRLYELQTRAAAAGASEQVPADGGFLIQPDFAAEILQIAHDGGQVYNRARQLPLSENTNAIKIPAIDESSRADGSRWGGVRMYWENEADALTASKPKFQLLELITKKLTGLYYATNEVLQDARLMGALVMTAFGEEMAFKMDDGCIRGSGSGQLLGILNAGCLVTVAKESGQAASTIVYENIKKMWGRCWARSRTNAVWFVNQDTEQQLYGLSQAVGTAGGMPVFLPPGGATATPYSQLFGRPVIPIEQCDTLGSVGDIILADFSQYLTVDKGAMQAASSMHVRFLTDEQTFRWIYRVDGAPWWKTPLTPFKGSNTLSPFVALAAR